MPAFEVETVRRTKQPNQPWWPASSKNFSTSITYSFALGIHGPSGVAVQWLRAHRVSLISCYCRSDQTFILKNDDMDGAQKEPDKRCRVPNQTYAQPALPGQVLRLSLLPDRL